MIVPGKRSLELTCLDQKWRGKRFFGQIDKGLDNRRYKLATTISSMKFSPVQTFEQAEHARSSASLSFANVKNCGSPALERTELKRAPDSFCPVRVVILKRAAHVVAIGPLHHSPFSPFPERRAEPPCAQPGVAAHERGSWAFVHDAVFEPPRRAPYWPPVLRM